MNKVKNVFKDLGIGLILFIVSFAVLWINEGNNAKNIAIANYMAKNALQIESNKIESSNEGLLVAARGQAQTEETIQDELISSPKTLVLERKVEMYQWEENSHEENNHTTYSYEKKWSEQEIDSSDFHDKSHINPSFPVKSEEFYANNVKFGDFDLTSKQIKKIAAEETFRNLPPKAGYSIQQGEKYFSGTDIMQPKVGDILISYTYAPSGTYISMIGKQSGKNIVPDKYKKFSVYVQYNGNLSKEEIIEKFRHNNFILTNIFRLLGWLLMFIGLKLIASPITKIFNFIPILGDIVEGASSLVFGLFSLFLSLITIAIAWFAYRPIASLLLITVAIIIAIIIKKIAPKNKENKINEENQENL